MTITAICLVRHGETDWNVSGRLQGMTDVPLNLTGMRQAEQCGRHLQASDWDAVVTSPLKRARQTGDIINEKLKLPIFEMEEFKERHFGKAEGMSTEERTEAFPDKNYPGQEENEHFIQRIMEGLEKVNQRFPEGRVLLVAHGAVIGGILTVVSGGEVGSRKTPLLNACMSNIHFQEDSWKIINFNQVTHLSEQLVLRNV